MTAVRALIDSFAKPAEPICESAVRGTGRRAAVALSSRSLPPSSPPPCPHLRCRSGRSPAPRIEQARPARPCSCLIRQSELYNAIASAARGSVQSGFNEVAPPVQPGIRVARPHRSLQILLPSSRRFRSGWSSGIKATVTKAAFSKLRERSASAPFRTGRRKLWSWSCHLCSTRLRPFLPTLTFRSKPLLIVSCRPAIRGRQRPPVWSGPALRRHIS